MKTLKIIGLFFIFLFTVALINACSSVNEESNTELSDTTADTSGDESNSPPVNDSIPQTTTPTEARFLITTDGIGQLQKDADIPASYEVTPYQIVKEKREEMQEGTKYEISVSKLMKSNVPVAEIYNNEIWIVSGEFKTEKQIGVESTVDEFLKAYPDAKIWYTYVSGRFIMETGILPNIQFIIDETGYTGSKGRLSQSDMVVLKPDEIKKDTKIVKIRYF